MFRLDRIQREEVPKEVGLGNWVSLYASMGLRLYAESRTLKFECLKVSKAAGEGYRGKRVEAGHPSLSATAVTPALAACLLHRTCSRGR